jgi:hypothetical protein
VSPDHFVRLGERPALARVSRSIDAPVLEPNHFVSTLIGRERLSPDVGTAHGNLHKFAQIWVTDLCLSLFDISLTRN